MDSFLNSAQRKLPALRISVVITGIMAVIFFGLIAYALRQQIRAAEKPVHVAVTWGKSDCSTCQESTESPRPKSTPAASSSSLVEPASFQVETSQPEIDRSPLPPPVKTQDVASDSTSGTSADAVPGGSKDPAATPETQDNALQPSKDTSGLSCQANAFLTLFTPEGERLWKGRVPCTKDSGYVLEADHLPLVSRSTPGQLSAQAVGHLADSVAVDLIVHGGEEEEVSLRPQVAYLQLQPVLPLLTFLFLFPAALGLGASISHLLSGWQGKAETYSHWAGICWTTVILLFGGAYYSGGHHWMVILWPDLVMSTGVVIFAFLGTLTYVAYSIYDKSEGFFTEDGLRGQRDKYFRALGGRILIAPYTAVVIQAVLAPSFPSLRGGSASLFLAFFTGLWIKVVLDILHDIGGRFLSSSTAAKVAQRLESQDESSVPPPRSGSALALRPPSPFFDAVRQARQQLYEVPGVAGVGPGTKVTDGRDTEQQAIVVYVYEKKDLPTGDPETIPAVIAGVRTDVVEIAPPSEDSPCHTPALSYFWDKIYRDHLRQRGNIQPASPQIEQVGDVLVLTVGDAQDAFFQPNARIDQKFVPRLAYELVRGRLGDRYQFIDFVLDLDGGVRPQGNYYVAVHNDIAGIHFHKDPAPLDPSPEGRFSERADWNSHRLIGCQVHGQGKRFLTPWTLLHELGHAWCAYVHLNFPDLHLLISDGPGAGHHWSSHFDNGASCMDYDRMRWVHVRDDIFRQEPVPEEDTAFCDLDLYLMGFKSRQQMEPLRFVIPRPPAAGDNLQPGEVRAEVRYVDMQRVADAVGDWRHPDTPPPNTFHQAFVVVTQDADSGRTLAQTVDTMRRSHEERFKKATGGATLKTALSF